MSGQVLCRWCGATVSEDEGPCPRSFECPTCKAQPGSPCRRPSGHNAAQMHAPRLALAGLDSRGMHVTRQTDEPDHEAQRLFEPAPEQLTGQIGLEV